MRKTKFYLAGSYARREELAGYARELQYHGHEVTAKWLDGDYDDLVYAFQGAEDDLCDIRDCEVFVLFTDNYMAATGGKDFEAGFAYAHGKRHVLIGERRNVFHHLTSFRVFATVQDFLRWAAE